MKEKKETKKNQDLIKLAKMFALPLQELSLKPNSLIYGSTRTNEWLLNKAWHNFLLNASLHKFLNANFIRSSNGNNYVSVILPKVNDLER